MRIIALFGRGYTGKTRCLGHLINLIHSEGKGCNYLFEGQDARVTLDYKGHRITICTWGDNEYEEQQNIDKIQRNQPEIAVVATRTKGETVRMVEEGILLRSRTGKLSMAKEYQSIYSEIHSTKNINWIGALKSCAAKYDDLITRKTYMEFLPEWVSVDRVRYILSKLEASEVLRREGTGKGTKYRVIKVRDDIEL